ncbi:hypothetical protein FHS15_003839 [Paenibacillus castaneae]|nr:S-layer homology domain-containing protein [Paenibacillus castaneae]NIK78693.1 hypothetical protein [Paenibacillus castaneae]
MNGYPNGTFKPNAGVTRAEFAVMLARALELQGAGAGINFIELDNIGIRAQQAIACAVEAGIITGYTDGSFRPNAKISRSEMITMLSRALGITLDNAETTSYADDSDIPAWAKAAVKALAEAGIIQGRGGNRFVPNGTGTRAEAVTVLLGALELNNK